MIEIGRKYAPDHRQCCQEALPGDADTVFAFVLQNTVAEGVLGPPLFVPHHPTAIEQEVQEPRMWSLHIRLFWHFLCLLIGGVGGVV